MYVRSTAYKIALSEAKAETAQYMRSLDQKMIRPKKVEFTQKGPKASSGEKSGHQATTAKA